MSQQIARLTPKRQYKLTDSARKLLAIRFNRLELLPLSQLIFFNASIPEKIVID